MPDSTMSHDKYSMFNYSQSGRGSKTIDECHVIGLFISQWVRGTVQSSGSNTVMI